MEAYSATLCLRAESALFLRAESALYPRAESALYPWVERGGLAWVAPKPDLKWLAKWQEFMQSIEPQWKNCQYSCSAIINHEVLSSEILHLRGPLWIILKCSFWLFFLIKIFLTWNSGCNFSIKTFSQKEQKYWKLVFVHCWTWSDGDCRSGRIVSCPKCKCWLVPRSDLVDHLTLPHSEGTVSEIAPGIFLSWF